MQELLEYRRRLLDRFAAQPADLLQAVRDLDRGRRAAPGIGEWSPHQVLSHLRDAESRVFLPACRRIVEEDQPKLEAFDGQEWMVRNYDADESHDELCKAFTLARQKAVTVVGGLPALA